MASFFAFMEKAFVLSLLGLAAFAFLCARFPSFRGLALDILRRAVICAVSWLLAFLYLISPIDIIPDPIPILGQLDDLGVVTAAALTIPWAIAKTLKSMSRKKRHDKPTA